MRSLLDGAGNNVLSLQLSVDEIRKYEMKMEKKKSQESGLGASAGTVVTKYILKKAKK